MISATVSRAATTALRSSVRPQLPTLARSTFGSIRGYAEGVSDKLQLSLILPHAALYDGEVSQVNLTSTSGEMGILASHVPSIEQLAPGLLEVIESNGSKKWFVSGGFATMHPNNKLTINAIEAYEIEQFSQQSVQSALSEAQRVASGAGSNESKAEAEIEVQVYQALQAALQSK